MKLLKKLFLFGIASTLIASKSFAAGDNDVYRWHNESAQRDYEAVQEFVYSKRTIPLAEKVNHLYLAGDIRPKWASITQKINGTPQTGVVDRSKNFFGIETNLYIDYVCDRAWGVAWLQFDDTMGIPRNKNEANDPQGCNGSGTCEDICLRKAYFGINICADGCSRFDIEVGRRPLYSAFDSRIQFQSNFDGILLRYNRAIDCYGDFYLNAAVFVVNEKYDHYSYAVETGLLDVLCCNLDLKYSLIYWVKSNSDGPGGKHPLGFEYINSQFTAAYRFVPDYLCVPTKIYGAFLVNHAADKNFQVQDGTGKLSNVGRQNIAWYLGFIIGEVCHCGDWALDIGYQYVEAHAIADCDVSGIGRGNIPNTSLTDGSYQGNANYQGWRFEGLYALTDNLSIDSILEFSREADARIGGKNTYSKFEVKMIYAF